MSDDAWPAFTCSRCGATEDGKHPRIKDHGPEWHKLLIAILIDKFVGIGPVVAVTKEDQERLKASGCSITFSQNENGLFIQLQKEN